MKRHKGRVSHVPREELKMEGDYAIVSQTEGRISTKQIETAIMTLKRTLPSGTGIKTRIQGHLAVSEKPLEVRMGKGKGPIGKRVARVRMNTIIIEIEKRGQEPERKYEAGLRVLGTKLPVRYKIIKREKREEKEGNKLRQKYIRRGGGWWFIQRLTSKKINELDSDRSFNPKICNKDRKPDSRLGSGNQKDKESERKTSERI